MILTWQCCKLIICILFFLLKRCLEPFTYSHFSSPTRSANLEQLFWMEYWTGAVQCNCFMVHPHFRGSIFTIIFHSKCFEYVKSVTPRTMYSTLRMLAQFLRSIISFVNHLVNEARSINSVNLSLSHYSASQINQHINGYIFPVFS